MERGKLDYTGCAELFHYSVYICGVMRLLCLYVLLHLGHELELVTVDAVMLFYADGIEDALHFKNKK